MLTSKQFAGNPFSKEYGEVSQSNPLRWAIYTHNEADGLFHPQSSWFKCKDFFNEVVKLYNTGATSYIYGFTTEGMVLNPYGVFIRLKYVRDAFYQNISLINIILKEQLNIELLPVPIEDQKGECLLLLPRVLFNNTFTISKVSLWIRACNVSAAFSSYEEMQQNSGESMMTVCSTTLLPPENYQDYWFYASKENNSKVSPDAYISLIHNNGFINWKDALLQDGVEI